MYGHIYQDFIITTHYYIVFYHFNNSYLQLSHVVDLRHVKRSLNLRASRNLGKITGKNFSPTVPPFATRISRVIADAQAPDGESGNV